MATLPKTLLEAHLAKMGHSPATVELETDGEALILKKAILVNGELYDVFVHRWDENGLIQMGDQTPVLKRVIEEVQERAQSIFQRVGDPERVQYFYTDPSSECFERDLISQVDRRIDNPIKNPDAQPLTVQDMAKIHRLFFKQVISVLGGEDELARARLIPKDIPIPMDVEPSSPVPIEEALPPSMIDASTSTDKAPKPTEEGKQKLRQLQKTAREVRPPNFLNGISFEDLKQYSRQAHKNPSDRLYHAYALFQNVARKTERSEELDSEEKAMFAWLKELYSAEYQNYLQLKKFYDKNVDDKTFPEWCRYYAAKAIACYVAIPKQAVEALTSRLSAIDI